MARTKRQRKTRGRKGNAEPPPAIPIEAQLSSLAATKDMGILQVTGAIRTEATNHQARLAECINFDFLKSEHITSMARSGHGLATTMFWNTFNRLLIYCVKSESLAILKILDAITLSIALDNEISLALAARALIEHAAATSSLERSIAAICTRAASDIWPAGTSQLPAPTDEEHTALQQLLRFALGCRVQITDETTIPLLSGPYGDWKKFNEELEQVPEPQRAINAMTDVEKLGKAHFPPLRTIYAFLSEYCHPNSSSRSFDFIKRRYSSSTTAVTAVGIGARHIKTLIRNASPCVTTEISRFLASLSRAIKPMPPLTESRTPFPGAILRCDEFGRPFWIHVQSLKIEDCSGAELSAEHLGRIKEIFFVFKEFLECSLETFIELAEKDPNPERDIVAWEQMAVTFNDECTLRGNISHSERRLLYVAVFLSTMASNIDDLFELDPTLADLPDIRRVFLSITNGASRARHGGASRTS